LRWQAMPMPDTPAPTISTSTCCSLITTLAASAVVLSTFQRGSPRQQG